jgi:DNA-binding GntR family transcriptional regulator
LPVVKNAEAESLAMKVFEDLRFAILNRELAPGTRLKPAELGRELGVSLGVVREALGLLAAKSLVRIDRNRGFHVTTLSLEDLANLTFARVTNEGAALRLSVQRGGVTWESEVLAAHHRLASLPMFLPDGPDLRSEEWARAHLAFHHKLIDACGNPILLDICDRLSDAAELYRAWSGVSGREAGRDVVGEHQALCDAALAHEADRAVDLFEKHISLTQTLLVDSGLASGQDQAAADAS